jgi:methylmalonyl-CoA mutase N-terminal domain/subunit
MCRFHTQTAGVTLTAQQPDNNVIRSTMQALAAVLGGTQSLHVNSKDEALALPTAESAELSLRTQQVLANESGVTETVDPLAGSYYVESLTDRLEDEASDYIRRIDEMGGALGALDKGFQIREIHNSAYLLQQQVERGDRIVVGVNAYQTENPPIADIQRIDPEQTRHQLARLKKVKAERDGEAVQAALARLKAVAEGTDNTMPSILEAVEAYATVGEIADTLRSVFGEQREFAPF